MASQGPNSPTSNTTTVQGGAAWTNPGNVYTSITLKMNS